MAFMQHNDLEGNKLDVPVWVSSSVLEIFFDFRNYPDGLVDIDMNTGLAIVVSRGSRVQMKFGKLLKKLGREDKEVRESSSILKAKIAQYNGVELKIAYDQDEIIEVYERGPHSCMAGKQAVACYAGPDTAVAYVMLDERIVARSVIATNEDLKVGFIHIYGNSDLLKPLLEKAGYGTQVNMNGCRLLRLTQDDNVMCPYLDDDSWVTDDGDYLLLDEYGDHQGNQEGEFLGKLCDCCGSLEQDLDWSEDLGEELCYDCFHDKHVYVSGYYYSYSSNDIVEINDEYYLKSDCTFSDHEDEWLLDEDAVWCCEDDDHVSRGNTEQARTSDYDTETCIADNCTTASDGIICHDNYIEEYEELLLEEEEEA